MDCKYVRQNHYLCFTFNPLSTSFFYLAYLKNKLRIVQQNLYNSLIIHQFPVPIKQQELDVDNFALTYNQYHKLIILTLSDHILIYSIERRTLVFAGQARGRNPYFITKTATYAKQLYFSATEQHNVYSIDLLNCIQTGSITNYNKFKVPPQVQIIDIDVIPKKLAALCSDSNLRIWQLDSMTALRGVALQKIGVPVCLQFSKEGTYLLIGTLGGYVQALDGQTLGISNTVVLIQKISNDSIKSISWFHYSGQEQSRRFLSFTSDGNVKLYSFYFERQHKKDKFMGKATQLSLLHINRNRVKGQLKISTHNFSNFILFTPGILLHMVDHYPRIYYPVITSQINHSFQSLVPNLRREVKWQRDFFFVDGLEIKRLREQVQPKISLSSVLEYQGLKILKLDFRPISIHPTSKYKFLLSYYSGSMVRSLVLSKVSMDKPTQVIEHFKEYAGTNVIFLGSPQYIEPLILLVQEDKQTITIISEEQCPQEQLQLAEPDQKAVLQLGPGEIYTRNIKIKVHKVYVTPFRNHYVIIYQSQNLLRYSNNINYSSQLLDYDVCTDLSLRLDYTDIIIDVIWTSKGEIGAVVCLDKIAFINSELKIIKQAMILGYVVQAQWMGYTLIVSTKIDVQYVDVFGRSLQLYCLEDHDSKYLIMGIFADRVLGIEKRQNKIKCKIRYFNLMEPLLGGYLAYHKLLQIPIEPMLVKKIIEAYSPFFLVSEHLLLLLNQHQLTSFSQYIIENNIALYSRSIRASTLNLSIKMERFIQQELWIQNRKTIIDIFLSYWQLHDSSDSYYRQKAQSYLEKFSKLVGGQFALNSILNAAKNPDTPPITIAINFGQKGLVQIYYDFKEAQTIKMQILPFKAENVGEWVGQFGAYIQSAVAEDEVVELMMEQKKGSDQKEEDEQEDSQFKNLIIYYRLDEGKGEIVQDLSDYGNEGNVVGMNDDTWVTLNEDPMEIEDKWGKKCPPQFAVNLTEKCFIMRQKKINLRSKSNLTIQLWLKCAKQQFTLLKIGNKTEFGMNAGVWFVKHQATTKKLKNLNEDSKFKIGMWNHICFIYTQKSGTLKLLINSVLSDECSIQIQWDNSGFMVGCGHLLGTITQIRIWKKVITLDQIKDSMRTPLEIVAEKRKRLKMKIKQKKKNTSKDTSSMFPSLDF